MSKPRKIVLSPGQLNELHADAALFSSFLDIMQNDEEMTTLTALAVARHAKRQLNLPLIDVDTALDGATVKDGIVSRTVHPKQPLSSGEADKPQKSAGSTH